MLRRSPRCASYTRMWNLNNSEHGSAVNPLKSCSLLDPWASARYGTRARHSVGSDAVVGTAACNKAGTRQAKLVGSLHKGLFYALCRSLLPASNVRCTA